MKTFYIWCEGFQATGQSAGAMLLGYGKGKNLKEACFDLAEKDREFKYYFDEERMTYWGCRLFDNVDDARKSFG